MSHTSAHLYVSGAAVNVAPLWATGAEFDPQQVGDICASAFSTLHELLPVEGLLDERFYRAAGVVSVAGRDRSFTDSPPDGLFMPARRFVRLPDAQDERVSEIPRFKQKGQIILSAPGTAQQEPTVLDLRIAENWDEANAGAVVKAALRVLGVRKPRELEPGGRFDELFRIQLGTLIRQFPDVIRLKGSSDRLDPPTRPLPRPSF